MEDNHLVWDIDQLTRFVSGSTLHIEGAPGAVDRALALLGPHAADIAPQHVGRANVTAYHPDDRDGLTAAWHRASEHPGTVASRELRILVEGRWRLARVEFLSLLDHELAVLLITTRYVTDDTAWDVPEPGIETIVPGNAAAWALIHADLDGTIHRVEGPSRDLLGIGPDDLVGTNIVDLIHPDDVESSAVIVRMAATIPSVSRSMRHRFVRADGSTVWVEATLSYDPATGRVQVLLIDIERQRAERAALEASHLEIQELAEEFRILAEEVPTGAFRADASGRIRFANDRFRALAGAGYVETLHDLADPADAAIVDGALARVLATDEEDPDDDSVQVEFGRRGDGRPLSLRLCAVRAGGSPRQGVVGILIDAAPTAELRARARTDPLTGLLNRQALGERIDTDLAAGLDLTVLFVDFDGFKEVNDRHGHHAGDEVLRAVARRLRNAVRETEEVGRYGGDEFVVVCRTTDDETVENLVARVRAVLGDPVHFDDSLWQPEASIGMATAEPGDTASSLLRRADADMYRVKRAKGRRRPATGEEARSASGS